MSFYSSPVLIPRPIAGSQLSNSVLDFNTPNCSTTIALRTANIFTGMSLVAGVERLVYDSVSPGYLFYLVYFAVGTDLQNVRVRIEADTNVQWFNENGMAPGVADRGGVIWNGGPLPFKRLKIYLTTQFVDGQATVGLQGLIEKVAA